MRELLVLFVLLVSANIRTSKAQLNGNSSTGNNSYNCGRDTFNAVTEARLPTHLRPVLYDLKIEPFLEEGNFTFKGRVVISIEVLEADAKNVTLHSAGLRILSVTIVDKNGTVIPIAETAEDKEKHWLIIFTQEALHEGRTISVTIDYDGNLRNDNLGFFYQTYLDPVTLEVKYVAATQFQDAYARTALPCFDDPSMKAVFQVSIERKAAMKTLSNAVLNFTYHKNHDYHIDVYRPSPIMSTYLLAFVVTSFECSEAQSGINGALISVCSQFGGRNKPHLAQTVAPKILDFFDQTFGISYQLEKLDFVGVPNFYFEAMENWGLIIGSNPFLENFNTIAHEIAHQWFGNFVTMKWWNK